MTPRITCHDCGQGRARYARGVCRVCYGKRAQAGTLYQLPALGVGGRRALRRPITDHDDAVVERVLGGDWRLPATPSERAEVCERWVASGRSLYRLAQLTGWRPDRYYRHKDAA